jgi:hypothetical protein
MAKSFGYVQSARSARESDGSGRAEARRRNACARRGWSGQRDGEAKPRRLAQIA